MTKTIDAIYTHGVLKPRVRLPFREQARLKLTLVFPDSPVARTRGLIRVSPQTARSIIYGEEFDLWA